MSFVTLPNSAQVVRGAIAFGTDGTAYHAQSKTSIGAHTFHHAEAPITESSAVKKVVRYVGIDTTRACLCYSNALHSCAGWHWQMFYAEVYKNNEEISNTPFSTEIQNVDVFGIETKAGVDKEFRFRKVVANTEKMVLSRWLEAEAPSAEIVQEYVDEAILLTEIQPGCAPTATISLVTFYCLRNKEQKLVISTEEGTQTILPTDKELLMTYPAHPNAQEEKVKVTAALLKEKFEVKLGKQIDAVHINKHPLKIQEPHTVSSNLPLHKLQFPPEKS